MSWKKESERHTLSAKGVRTSARSYKLPPVSFKCKNILVVDIDGTLFDITERWNLAKSKYKEGTNDFWDELMKVDYLEMDKPIPQAAKTLSEIKNVDIVYLSGRRAGLYERTKKLLEKHGFPTGKIFLRPKGMPVTDFKYNVLKEIKKENNILAHIGDRDTDKLVSDMVKIPFIQTETNKSWKNLNIL